MATILIGTMAKAAGWNAFWSGVGLMAGNMIDQKIFSKQQRSTITAERMDSTQMQDSSYGNMIPIIFGIARTSGNVIFATSFVSHRHEETQRSGGGGKGGGGGGSSTTTIYYTYSISMATAICKGPIMGVRRLWVDGAEYTMVNESQARFNALCSNISSIKINSSDGLTDTKVNQALNAYSGQTYTFKRSNNTNKTFSARVYLGTDAQNPDSYMEAARGGIGSTPGYRGLAYLMLQNWDLTDFGNRIPQIQFEVVTTNVPVPANYSGGAYSGLYINGHDLSGGFFSNSTFTNCTFINCRLDNTDWTNSKMTGCNYTGSVIRDSTFDATTITSCTFDNCDARGANWGTANISGSSFVGADLREADL